jgi:hypothetical protein
MKGRTTALLLLAVFLTFILAICYFPAQASGYEWYRTFGGHQQDNCFSLINTSDGGYLIGGWTDWHFQNSSYAWDIGNFFLLKTDKNGNQEWYHIYGDNQSFMGGYVCEAPGSGYVLGGAIGQYSTGSICLIKVDANGRTLWEKTYWPGFDGRVKSLEVAPDGYIMAGMSNCTSNCSVFLMKFDLDGNLAWNHTYDEPGLDPGRVLPAQDGGFIVAGGPYTERTGQMFLMKADASGNQSWMKYYGSGYTGGLSVIEDRAGGYVIAGHNSTANGRPWRQYENSEVYIVRTDTAGDVIWEKTYDLSPDDDYANAIVQMDDGGYAVTGFAVRTRDGYYVIDADAFLLRLDENGTQQWVKKFGSPGEATGIAVVTSDDGAIVLAGDRRNSDILLIKSTDAPCELTPVDEAIKSVDTMLYHSPYIFYCWAPLFLAAFISLSVALIAIKRSIERKKKPQ